MNKSIVVGIIIIFLCSNTFGAVPADVYVHEESGFEFPDQLGKLKRQEVTYYERKEDGISISYGSKEKKGIALTIYVFPSPKYENGEISNLIDHLDYEVDLILENTIGTKEIKWPKNIPMWSDEGVPGGLVAFDFSGKGTAISLLQLYDYGAWRVKFRTTYDIKLKSAPKEIDRIHRAFNWKKEK